jgi:hypothetical protein
MMPIFTDWVWWDVFRSLFFRSTTAFAYLSVPVVALAVLGMASSGARGLVLGGGALITAAFALVMPESPLFPVYKAIPGFAMFRFPLRLLTLTALLAAVTAALGLSALARRPVFATPLRRVVLDAVALGTIVTMLVWPLRYDAVMPWNDQSQLAQPDKHFTAASRSVGDGRMYVPGDRLDLRQGAFPRQGTFQGVRVLQDYEPLTSRRLAMFLAVVAGLPPPRADTFPPFNGSVRGPHVLAHPELLDQLAVRTVVTPVSTIPSGGIPGWTPTNRLGDLVTYTNANAVPRAYVAERARFVADDTAALDTLTGGGADGRSEVVLVGEPVTDDDRALTTAPQVPFVAASIVTDEPERLVVDVAPRAPSVLVVADAFAPGWEAFVDGRQRRVWQANHLVRGVVLKAGDRSVELRYHAPGFALGVAAFVLVWGVTLSALAVGRVRRSAGGERTASAPA